MRDDAFARAATPLETAMQRRQRRGAPIVYLRARRPGSDDYVWLRGFVCGLTVAALAVAMAMVTR